MVRVQSDTVGTFQAGPGETTENAERGFLTESQTQIRSQTASLEPPLQPPYAP